MITYVYIYVLIYTSICAYTYACYNYVCTDVSFSCILSLFTIETINLTLCILLACLLLFASKCTGSIFLQHRFWAKWSSFLLHVSNFLSNTDFTGELLSKLQKKNIHIRKFELEFEILFLIDIWTKWFEWIRTKFLS